MTTEYTPLLGLALPATGELFGAWGDVVNVSITELVETAVAGTTILSADADVTLSTNEGEPNQARSAVLLWTATGTATRTITAPARNKLYAVINRSGGTQSIKVVGVGPTTGVTLIQGESALIAWDGTDFRKISSVNGIIDEINANTITATDATLTNTGITNLTAGTEDVTTSNITTANITTANVSTLNATKSKVVNIYEDANIVSADPAGTVNFDVIDQSVLYYTLYATGNWTLNVRGNSGTTLNSLMATGDSLTIAFLTRQPPSAFYQTGFTIDGSTVYPKWQGGSAPSYGNADSIDVYTFTIIKTGSGTYTVLASQNQFK